MLVQKAMTFLKNNGMSTVSQLVEALDIDADSVNFIMKKLIESNVVDHVKPAGACCKNSNGCNACSIANTEYYCLRY